jgi:cell division protein FtsQ
MEIELVPRVGQHIIYLGQIDGYEEKLERLLIFYEKGLSQTGWNQYTGISLKYKDQVVCTKKKQ